jgi:hypothetical protein
VKEWFIKSDVCDRRLVKNITPTLEFRIAFNRQFLAITMAHDERIVREPQLFMACSWHTTYSSLDYLGKGFCNVKELARCLTAMHAHEKAMYHPLTWPSVPTSNKPDNRPLISRITIKHHFSPRTCSAVCTISLFSHLEMIVCYEYNSHPLPFLSKGTSL